MGSSQKSHPVKISPLEVDWVPKIEHVVEHTTTDRDMQHGIFWLLSYIAMILVEILIELREWRRNSET